MTTLATTEPSIVRAGDTWGWARDLPDYPASVWTLAYTLFALALAEPVTLTATPDGARHVIQLASYETQDLTPGDYSWIASVSDGTDRYPVGEGRIQVLPDLANLGGVDGRSHARRMVAAIEAVLENRASAAEIDLVSAAIGDLATSRQPELLHTWRARYLAEVAAENAALAAARGERPGNFVQMRF